MELLDKIFSGTKVLGVGLGISLSALALPLSMDSEAEAANVQVSRNRTVVRVRPRYNVSRNFHIEINKNIRGYFRSHFSSVNVNVGGFEINVNSFAFPPSNNFNFYMGSSRPVYRVAPQPIRSFQGHHDHHGHHDNHRNQDHPRRH